MATQDKTDNMNNFQAALEEWNKNHTQQGNSGFDPVPILNKMASLLEQETEEFYKMDPDPLDDRPPGRQISSCGLGQMMKCVFKNDDFMNTIVGTYLLQGSFHSGGTLFTAVCRVLLVLLPGLEASVPFREMDGVVERLYHWAEFGEEPLRSYATGLLSGAMELNDMAVKFRDEGIHVVPIMLDRLHALIKEEKAEKESPAKGVVVEKQENCGDGGGGGSEETRKSPRYFAVIGTEDHPSASSSKAVPSESGDVRTSFKRSFSPGRSGSTDFHPPKKSRKTSENLGFFDSEHSNSSWAEMRPLVIGTYSLHPLTSSMKQRLILQYLTPLGDYHELLKPILEHDAMSLIFYYINLNENKDIRLAFDALRFLSVILCHKKFAAEFIARSGVQKLLEIHRPSIAATGVSLCFYYITYFEDATERMCALPYQVLSDVVSYNLWLMECSHDSSRCHACLFFSQSFHYKVILELFDKKDGLRRLINVIGTLSILNVEEQHNQTDDELHQMRQSARLVCGALRHYFEVHTIIKADELRSVNHHDDLTAIKDASNYKSLKGAKMSLEENMDVLLECLPPKSNWAPEMHIHKLGGLSILCQLVAMSPEWESFSGKVDTIVYALDVLAMCAVSHRTLLLFSSSVNLPDNITTPIMSVFVGLAEGEIITEADIQKAALRVLCNCVCGPVERFGQNLSKYQISAARKKSLEDDLLSSMWHDLRINNGIMALLKLLSVKTPILEADIIRTLACKALVGMSRSETIRQIISKRPPLNNGQLQSLVKEPILSDKRLIHLLFCKYSSILLEKIAGRQANVLGVATLEEIRRAGVVAQTKIVYQDKELLQLIHGHLVSKGLNEAASTLHKEASLPKVLSHHTAHSPVTPKIGRQLSVPQGPMQASSTSTTNREIFPGTQSSSSSSFLPVSHRPCTPPPISEKVTSPSNISQPSSLSSSTPASKTPAPSGNTTIPSHSTLNGPLKFTLNRPHPCQATPPPPKSTKRRFLKEREGYIPAGVQPRAKGKQAGADFEVTLDKIVTEYLRKQHALCPQPISTCPTMSLFLPHRCPEPLGKNSAALSITSRIFDRQLRPPHGGPNGARLDRRYIHCKLTSISTFRDASDDGLASCGFDCASDNIFVGSFSGELRFMDMMSDGDDFQTFVCHSSPLIHINTSPVNCDMVFTSTWGASENTALWSLKRGETASLNLKYRFDENLANLANLSHDHFIGTKDMVATIYDTATGTKVQTLYDESRANNYKFNEASFNPTDELVLNDGNLWDVRSNKMVYKFDKFNQFTSGCFHPRGLEVVINSEIWDIRTFRLIRTVPSLDQCQILFNHSGDVIYAIRVDEEMSDSIFSRRDYASTLRTFDATDYNSIGTFDLKTKSIFDLAIDRNDHHIAVIENTAQHESDPEEAFCRIYELGKTREPEDQVEDDDDNAANDDDNYDDDDDDDNDTDDDDDFVEIANGIDSDFEVSTGSDDAGELSPGGSSYGGDDDDDNIDLDDFLFELV